MKRKRNTSPRSNRKRKRQEPPTSITSPTLDLIDSPLIDVTDNTNNDIVLSDRQSLAIHLACNQKSIFITGCGGTGKSIVIKTITKTLRQDFDLSVAVTASTGIAARNIGGTTIHSKFSIAPQNVNTDKLFMESQEDYKRFRNRSKYSKWTDIDVLIIDEISMVDGSFFRLIDWMARHARKVPNLPFGGLQLIVCGDFFQLPPIGKTEDKKIDYCFNTDVWNEMEFDRLYSSADDTGGVVLLDHVYRQNDSNYIHILERMREGVLIDGDWMTIDQCTIRDRNLSVNFEGQSDIASNNDGESEMKLMIRDLVVKQWGKMVHLYAINRKADHRNHIEYQQLSTPSVTFKKYYEFETKNINKCNLVRNVFKTVDDCISLKIGCRVILTRNLQIFDSLEKCHLNLVNGSIGTIMDLNDIGCRVLFDSVRDKCLEKGIVDPWDMHSEFITFKQSKYKDDNNIFLGSCYQIPLRLAFAISIHKSQGMTLDRARVDLSDCFAPGQVYVACSRVKSLDGLKVEAYKRSALKVSPIVKTYYENLH
jgi:ATP-dependent DNA helicase PIF1